jgi:UDP-N-acetylglucosamine 3-dehydrogenase
MTVPREGAPRRGARRQGAIIGFGNVAANGHLPGWQERSDFCIAAVSDPDAERRALATSLLPGVRTYADPVELLRRETLDFVDIAAPPALHAPLIIAAANAGVHVLCEKPLTASLPQYHAVHAAVRRAGVVLHTVHNWKYSEAFLAAQKTIAGGALGALTRISFDTARNGCAAASGDNWRVQAAVSGGGILVDHGWHAFYLMLALAQETPQRISATLERRRYVNAEVEDTALCTVDFPSLTGEIRLTWAASERRTQWRLTGEDGELLVDDDCLRLRSKGTEQVQPLSAALSAGSHHPDWFAGVIDSFRHEIDEPAVRGTNQTEAEWCLLLLSLAYASGAQGARTLDVPTPSGWLAGTEAAA